MKKINRQNTTPTSHSATDDALRALGYRLPLTRARGGTKSVGKSDLLATIDDLYRGLAEDEGAAAVAP